VYPVDALCRPQTELRTIMNKADICAFERDQDEVYSEKEQEGKKKRTSFLQQLFGKVRVSPSPK